MTARYRLLFTGARDWTDARTLWTVLDTLHTEHPDLLVVHGACYPRPDRRGQRPARSADWLAHLWCRTRSVPEEEHPAAWENGPGAGPRRNAAMVRGGADECVAFLTAASRGSLKCARMAELAGIPVRRWHA